MIYAYAINIRISIYHWRAKSLSATLDHHLSSIFPLRRLFVSSPWRLRLIRRKALTNTGHSEVLVFENITDASMSSKWACWNRTMSARIEQIAPSITCALCSVGSCTNLANTLGKMQLATKRWILIFQNLQSGSISHYHHLQPITTLTVFTALCAFLFFWLVC